MKKLIYIIGAVVIGMVAMLSVILLLIGGGTIKSEQTKIVLMSKSVEDVYDGEALVCDEWKMITGKLQDGHSIHVNVTGEQVTVGSSVNHISATVTDEMGADVTDYYVIEYQPGTITVTPQYVEITAESATKDYDEQPLIAQSWSITGGKLASGHSIVASFTDSLTNVGEFENRISVQIEDKDGKDVSSNYTVKCNNGKLTVKKRELTLKSNTSSKIYDAQPLVDEKYTIISGSVAPDHSIKLEKSSEITIAGETENKFKVSIIGLNGTDVSSNYDISYLFGTLTVLPRMVTVQTGSYAKVYDGTPIDFNDSDFLKANAIESWKLVDGELILGDSLSAVFSTTLTNVGTAKNEAVFSVVDESGADVTSNYKVVCVPGTLGVTKQGIVILGESDSKIYDGTPLENNNFTVQDEGLLIEGHTVSVTTSASITNVGTLSNILNVVIKDAGGADVTANYDLQIVSGELTVLPRQIAVLTPSFTKEYDGLPLETSGQYTLDSEELLLEGHKIETAELHASITNAGSVQNEFSIFKITDASGLDVTDNYDINFMLGILSVTPRKLTVRSASASKTYDGTPLFCHEYEIVSESKPLDGHEVFVTISGERTEVGESDNFIAEVIIMADGERVTFNYDITCQNGALVVKGENNAGSEGGSDGEGAGGGAGGGLGTGGTLGKPSDSEQEMLEIRSDIDGQVYLRFMSFGNYNGEGWTHATAYNDLLNGKYSYNYLTSIALKSAGKESVGADLKLLVDEYYLPYFADIAEYNYDIQTSDVIYQGSGREYSLYYYDYSGNGSDLADKLGEYSDEELAYRQFVYENYTFIDAETLLYMNNIITSQGFDPGDPEIIKKVAEYIQSAAKYNLDYPDELDGEANKVIAFLDKYKEGICQHYASSAVLLYRALGIPARYTVGFAGKTSAGEWVKITSKQAHAWAEVYVNGVGWIPVEVTGGDGAGGGSGSGGGAGGGGGEMKPGAVTVRPVDVYMQYDGVSVLKPEARLEGFSELEKLGYSYEVVVSGERKSPGISQSTIESLIIYNANGVDVTDSLTVTQKQGKIQVYIAEITVTTGSAQTVYDGQELTNSDCQIEGHLIDGHSIKEFECVSVQKNVGKRLNNFKLVIVDSNGDDVTDYYKINRKCGTLKVEAREIHIVADSAQKQYDGTELVSDGYSIESGSLCDGDVMTVVIMGSQTEIGRCENTIASINIVDKDGEDVLVNYKITYKNGTLRVTP